MLSDSILGKLYCCWADSWFCTLLGRFWRCVQRQARESLILRLAFGPTRADALYSESCCARVQRRTADGLLRLLRPLAVGIHESCICSSVAAAARTSRVARLECFFGAFCCWMFLVPHSDWNNLYALIGALVFLAAYLLLAAGGSRTLLYPDELGLGLALFALACLLSMLFTTAPMASLRVLMYFLTALILCYLVVAVCRDRQSLRRFLAFLYVSMLLVSLMGLAQRLLDMVEVDYMFTDTAINQGVPGRVYASLDNPNNLSGFLQVFLPIGAAYAAGTRRQGLRALLTLGLALPLVVLVMTYSRSGWLAMLLAAMVYVYFCDKKLLPVFILLGILALPLMPNSVLVRISTIFNARDTSRVHRIAIWQGVLKLLSDRGYWITGIGLGPAAFQDVYPRYAMPLATNGAFHSQMLYLELDLELGILGFVCFFWMLLKLAGRAGRAMERTDRRGGRLLMIAVLSTLAALAVSGAAEYVWYYQRCIFAFFLFLGVAMSALRIAESEAGPCGS